MDEIYNKTDREILVMIHTTLNCVISQNQKLELWQNKHEENDNTNFNGIAGKLNKVYIGIFAIILFLGWIAKSAAGL